MSSVVARREQRLEEQVAIVVARRAVARSRPPRDQVEARRPAARAGKTVVVHAQQAHDAERDAAHRHQLAERHAAGQKAAARRIPLAAPPSSSAAHRLADRPPRRSPPRAALRRPASRARDAGSAGAGPAVRSVTASMASSSRPRSARHCGRPGAPRPARGGSGTACRRTAPAARAARRRRLRRRRTAGPPRNSAPVRARHGVAEQQAVEPEPPGVLRAGRLPDRRRGARRRSPQRTPDSATHVRTSIELLADQTELRPHRVEAQQVEHLRSPRMRPSRTSEHGEEAVDHLVGRPHAAVGDAVRNARSAVRSAAEHRVDEGRVGVDVRRHHDHVVRVERRVRIEQREQLIVQHLHLAHRAVAGVDDDRRVVGPERQSAGCPPASRRDAPGSACRTGGRRAAWRPRRDRGRVVVGFLVVDPALRAPAGSRARGGRARRAADGPRWPGTAPRRRRRSRACRSASRSASRRDRRSPQYSLRRAQDEEVNLDAGRERREELDVQRRQCRQAEQLTAVRERLSDGRRAPARDETRRRAPPCDWRRRTCRPAGATAAPASASSRPASPTRAPSRGERPRTGRGCGRCARPAARA